MRAESGCSPHVLPVQPCCNKGVMPCPSFKCSIRHCAVASGVCGAEVEQRLVSFAADVAWVEIAGVAIEAFQSTKGFAGRLRSALS